MNGRIEILYLTKAPKFVLAIPTPKPKKIINENENRSRGDLNIVLIKKNGFTFIIINKKKIDKILFSTPDNSIKKLLDSQI